MKSDYQWVWNGELLRFAMVTAVAIILGVGSQFASAPGGMDEKWWIAPITMFIVQLIDYVRGKLPPVSPPTP